MIKNLNYFNKLKKDLENKRKDLENKRNKYKSQDETSLNYFNKLKKDLENKRKDLENKRNKYKSQDETSQYSQDETSQYSQYVDRQDDLQALLRTGKMSQEDYDRQMSNLADQFGAAKPDLETFETLLGKLTGSKMKQAGQEQTARRGDIYAGGLANMMSNF